MPHIGHRKCSEWTLLDPLVVHPEVEAGRVAAKKGDGDALRQLGEVGCVLGGERPPVTGCPEAFDVGCRTVDTLDVLAHEVSGRLLVSGFSLVKARASVTAPSCSRSTVIIRSFARDSPG